MAGSLWRCPEHGEYWIDSASHTGICERCLPVLVQGTGAPYEHCQVPRPRPRAFDWHRIIVVCLVGYVLLIMAVIGVLYFMEV